MNILSDINTVLDKTIPIETGVFTKTPPKEYIVITPLSDIFAVYSDNKPEVDIQEARISLFSKINYISRKNQLVKLLLQADFVITERLYLGYENDTGYHHYAIDVQKEYFLEEE